MKPSISKIFAAYALFFLILASIETGYNYLLLGRIDLRSELWTRWTLLPLLQVLILLLLFQGREVLKQWRRLRKLFTRKKWLGAALLLDVAILTINLLPLQSSWHRLTHAHSIPVYYTGLKGVTGGIALLTWLGMTGSAPRARLFLGALFLLGAGLFYVPIPLFFSLLPSLSRPERFLGSALVAVVGLWFVVHLANQLREIRAEVSFCLDAAALTLSLALVFGMAFSFDHLVPVPPWDQVVESLKYLFMSLLWLSVLLLWEAPTRAAGKENFD